VKDAVIERRASVPEELDGSRFDQAAARLLPEFSRTRLKRWIDSGALTLAGRPAEPKTRVEVGQELALKAALDPVVAVDPEPLPLAIVHEQPSLLVIDKPAGLVVHPGAGNPRGTLQNALLAFDPELARLPRAGIVHRLDKDTSGLLLIARTHEAYHALTKLLGRREIRRIYEGLVQGVLTGGGTVDAPIGRHPRARLKMAVREDGREARTRYRVMRRFRAHTHVRFELDTGRTHQIRVHMAHVRSPLVGDPLYGGRPRLPPRPSEDLVAALRAFRRQALHAARLEFVDPESGRELELTAPLPSDLAALLAALARDAAVAED
jgi:23S rRNA pseudouridine1911/1915/1917 synthase